MRRPFEPRLTPFWTAVTSTSFVDSLKVLLILDALFICLHVSQVLHVRFGLDYGGVTGIFASYSFNLENDRGFSEGYEFLKTSLCVVGILACYGRRRHPVYLSLGLVFAIVTIDNAFAIHEWMGSVLPFGQNAGELAAFVGAGLAGALLLWWTRPDSGSPEAVYVAGCVFFIGVLGFFAVVLDVAHDVIPRYIPHTDGVLGVLEEGGELIALSFGLAFVRAIPTPSAEAPYARLA